MKYIIGIDGGGSKTLGYIGNDQGQVFYNYTSGASNYHSVGIANTKSALKEVIENLCSLMEIGLDELAILSLGMAGCGRETDKRTMEGILSDLGLKSEIILNSDAFTALIGALGNECGVVTICGTGSICMGLDSKGNIRRAGGWGHIISDEGSGYSIGQNCLKAIMKSYDGIEQVTQLTKRVLDYWGLKSEEDLISYLYHEDRRKEDIASLAPIVFASAQEGDAVSIQIINEAIWDLIILTKKVIEKTTGDHQKMLVALDGGIFKNVTFVRDFFAEKLSAIYENIEIISPIFDGGIGAFIVGVKKLNKNFDVSNITIRI